MIIVHDADTTGGGTLARAWTIAEEEHKQTLCCAFNQWGYMDGLHGATTWMTSSKRQLPQTPEDLRRKLTNKHPFNG